MHISAEVRSAAVDPHTFDGSRTGRAGSPCPKSAGGVHEKLPGNEKTGGAGADHAVMFTDLPENVRSKIFGLLGNTSVGERIVSDLKSARAVNRDARRLINEAVRTFKAADPIKTGSTEDLAVVLATFPNLRAIDLSAHRTMTDMQIRPLRNAARLEVLDIRGLYKLTPKSAGIVAALPKLHTLIARYCPAFVSHGAIRRIADAPHLETLDLSQNPRADDYALVLLASAAALRTLNLTQCRNISVNGIALLAQFRALRKVDLSHNYHIRADEVGRQFLHRPEIQLQMRGCQWPYPASARIELQGRAAALVPRVATTDESRFPAVP